MKVYEIITNEILKKLDEGVIPWKNVHSGILGNKPRNLVSNKSYNGINRLLLLCQGYKSPYWLTFNQVNDLGGKIKKGEGHTKVVFWKIIKKEDQSEDIEKSYPMMRYYQVWNLDQTENVKIPKHGQEVPLSTFSPIELCEQIISKYKDCPEIISGSPAYSPTKDHIRMPSKESFNSPEFYYSVLFHEMAHSTMHLTRLNRQLPYDKEELVAEISACFLSGIAEISNVVFDNQVSYIHSWGSKKELSAVEWKNVLTTDPKIIIQAASMAQKASDFIQGINDFNKEE